MRPLASIAALAVGLLGEATPSHAQERVAQAGEFVALLPRDEPTTGAASDPLPMASLATVGVGALALGTGATLLATAPDEQRCGQLGGCLPASSRGTQSDAGAIATGAGTGLVAVGALGWLLTDQAPLRSGERRDAPALATTGLVTAGLGVGAVGAGLALGITGIDGFDAGRAAPWLAAGGGLVAIGVPLTLIGAAPEDHAERQAERADDERRRRAAAARRGASEARRREADAIEARVERGELERRTRDPGLVAAGALLVGVGGAALLGCAVAAATDDTKGWDGLGRSIGYAAGAGLGGLAAIGGVVMLGIGAQTDLVETGRYHGLAPREVRIGPASASASWSF